MKTLAVCALVLAAITTPMFAQGDPMRGLWVGEARLNYVTEVTVPLDKDNIPRPKGPERPTPTADVANIRLIFHVNGAGQVSLLKEVALLKRTEDVLLNDGDISLVTDQALFAEFPAQPGQRIASAVFDFGDQKATDAVQAVMDAAVNAAATTISGSSSSTQTEATDAATDAAQAIVDSADAEARFDAFLLAKLSKNDVATIATSGSATEAQAAAVKLRDTFEFEVGGMPMTVASFYEDARGVTMVAEILAAAAAVTDPEQKKAAAQNMAAAFADVANEYQRFIAGKIFADMIAPVAEAAAELGAAREILVVTGIPNEEPTAITAVAHGLNSGDRIIISGAGVAAYNGTHTVTKTREDEFTIPVAFVEDGDIEGAVWKHTMESILDAANAVPERNDALEEAIEIKVDGYDDTRGVKAIAAVVNAIVAAAAVSDVTSPALLTHDLIGVGEEALAKDVVRYPLPEMSPTSDYSNFIRAADAEPGERRFFPESPGVAATAAAKGAFEERRDNPLADAQSIRNKALAAAANALESVFGAAARAIRSELPMQGSFAVGEGDATLRNKLAPGANLGLPGVTGVVVLPAMHPTNPFRHRRHPDHTVGFDIVRKIRLDFDPEPEEPLNRNGFGVDRITGTYREEITKPANRVQGGLHKPLGPDRDQGLRVEGKFELSRVSLIDTLNAK